jgi:hypothetical protein
MSPLPPLGLKSFAPAFELVGSYDALATVTVPSGGAATVSFVGIPTGYKHLQLRFNARTSFAGNEAFYFKYNSDSSSSYTDHYLFGNGSTAGAVGATAASTGSTIFRPAGSTAGSNVFGVGIVDILDYENTNKYKTIRNLGGIDTNGAGTIFLNSGLWINTAAINRIDITSANAATIQQYSSFALYGVK